MNASTRSSASPSVWLAGALVVMPFLQLLPIDFDRSAVLFLLLPFLWSGRLQFSAALRRLVRFDRWLKATLIVALVAPVVSTIFADQIAPAATTLSCWGLLAATALIASELIIHEPAAGPRLLGAIAVGVTAGTLVVWSLWWWGGRGAVPLYAHHRIFGLHTLGGAVAAIALIIHFWNRPRVRNIWFVVGTINWGGLLWSGSRGPVLAVFVALFVWWLAGDATLRKRLISTGALLLVAGLLLSLAMWSPRPELGWWNAIHRTAIAANGNSALSVSAITSTRSDFWRESFHRVLLRPWLGHGPDAYRFLTPKLDGQQPHNFILQLLLDLGFLGAIPLLFIFGGIIFSGWRSTVASRGQNAAWLALTVASIAAGLLDGGFYHLLAFLPAAVAFGGIAAADKNQKEISGHTLVTVIGNTGLFAGITVLILHTWIFYALVVAPPPSSSTAWQTKVVRAFPSTTFGLWRWLDAWQGAEPKSALNWSRWAQKHSPSAPLFHIYAARLLLAEGDRNGAAKELRAALSEAHVLSQPAIAEMLRGVESPPR